MACGDYRRSPAGGEALSDREARPLSMGHRRLFGGSLCDHGGRTRQSIAITATQTPRARPTRRAFFRPDIAAELVPQEEEPTSSRPTSSRPTPTDRPTDRPTDADPPYHQKKSFARFARSIGSLALLGSRSALPSVGHFPVGWRGGCSASRPGRVARRM